MLKNDNLSNKRKIALTLREQAEKLVRKNVMGFGELSSKNLDCLCAIASTSLKKLFQENGYPAEVMEGLFVLENTEGNYHCWVESEGFAFDITATQFNEKLAKILVVSKDSEQYHRMFKEGKPAGNIQCFQQWRKDEKPHKNKILALLKGLLR